MADARAVYLVEMAGGLEGEAKSAAAAVDRLGTSAAQTRMRLATMADSAEHSTRATRGFADLLDRVAPGASRALQGMADLTDGFEAVSKTIMTGGGGVVALAGGAGALAIAGAGIVALGANAISVARDLEGVRESLTALGGDYAALADTITRTPALEDLGTSLQRLEGSTTVLSVTLADKMAPALTIAVDLLVRFVDLLSQAAQYADTASQFGRVAGGILTLGMSEAMRGGFSVGQSMADGLGPAPMQVGPAAAVGIPPLLERLPEVITDLGGAKKAFSDAEKLAMEESARNRDATMAWLNASNAAIEAQKQSAEAAKEALTGALSGAESALGSADLEGAAASVQGLGKTLAVGAAPGIASAIEGVLGSGLTGALATFGGPIGAAVGAVLDIIPNLDGLLRSFVDNVFSTIANLPGEIGNIIQNTIPYILERMPDIAGAIASLPFAIPVAIVKAIPSLLTGMVTLFPRMVSEFLNLIPALVTEIFVNMPKALLDGIKLGWEAIKESFAALLNPFKEGGALRTDLAAAKGEKRLLGIKVPFFESGGMVQRTGLAVVHQGERVLNREETQRGGTAGLSVSGVTVVAPDPRSFVQRLRELQGSYGIGLNLSPLVE